MARRWTGCPCGCMTKLPYIDDPDCVRRRPHPERSADAARELEAWATTVEHLHGLGLPAAVPPFAAAWLRRHRSIRADWITREAA